MLDNKIDINAYAIEIIDIWARLQMIEAKKCYVGSWVSGAVNPRSFRDSEDDYISSWTALTYACEHNYLQKAEWLIAQGADLHKISVLVRPNRFMSYVEERTALQIAQEYDYKEIISLLESAGAKGE